MILGACSCSGGNDGAVTFLAFGVAAAGAWLVHHLWLRFGKGGWARMSRMGRLGVVAFGITLAVLGVILWAGCSGQPPAPTKPGSAAAEAPPASGLPRLVDLGAGKCIPCKMMAPILEELKKTYAGRFNVQFIDIWENPDAGRQYGIRLIPTQIFFAPDGKELWRHEGLLGKEEILAKWKELGISLDAPAATPPKNGPSATGTDCGGTGFG